MRKTGQQIENDVFAIVKESELKTHINGSFYKSELRPLNSTKEDVVVSFMTGLDGQFQTGVLNINVYIPDIDNGSGTLVKNSSRCGQIEIILNKLIQSLIPSDYKFELGAIIQTFDADEINQHFVSIRLKFKLSTF